MIMTWLQAQYVFIHDAILESLVCGETLIAVTNFRLVWNKLSRIDQETGRTGLEAQHQVQFIIMSCQFCSNFVLMIVMWLSIQGA